MTTAAGATLYGVFRTGGLRMALPLEELREVIVRPAEFSPLPTAGVGLLGAVNLRHTVIPVLDPCLLAGRPSAAETGEVIIIVSSDGQLLGLLADAIEGSTHVEADALLAVRVGGGVPALFSHTFERADDGAVVALLDAAAIVDMPAIPAVADPAQQPGRSATATASVAAQARETHRTLLMFECGGTGLSIDVTHVHSVVPDLELHSSPLDGPICRGVAHLDGAAVPAIDPITLLALGMQPRADTDRGVVVSLPTGLITLIATDVTDITTVPAEDILPIPALSSPNHGLLAGLLTTDDRQYLVLDGQALRENAELAAFGNMNLRLDATTAQADPPPGGDPQAIGKDEHRVIPSVRKFLTYSIGVDAATPLEQIDEILPYPSHHLSLDDAPLIGMFTHRRTTIPLIDLPALLGRDHTPDPATARVLLVTVAAGITAGLVVPDLHAIEQAVWEEPPKTPDDLLQRPLVSLGTPEDNRLVPHFDLIAIAAEHLGRQLVQAEEHDSAYADARKLAVR
ncbi:chemotaxis protein CheW [Actinoplanes sp. TRM 88003]|uniref:Chemotaxis protein CheW n=1 Tax=Paractinoplanes aksuensis TaxID=2939490 RepID=A0ABT1DXT7_9ACTN|nr:chemotaxis protein CheW [Actinoplanes aksuensis]MCO8275580.1 chemotaxis protein CheW [Actinoplanes aksuensis]